MKALARRPWWKKKRWAAALAVWLAVAYPLSLGPAAYGVARGWLSEQTILTAYFPVLYLASAAGPPGEGLVDFARWWADLGVRHAASD